MLANFFKLNFTYLNQANPLLEPWKGPLVTIKQIPYLNPVKGLWRSLNRVDIIAFSMKKSVKVILPSGVDVVLVDLILLFKNALKQSFFPLFFAMFVYRSGFQPFRIF